MKCKYPKTICFKETGQAIGFACWHESKRPREGGVVEDKRSLVCPKGVDASDCQQKYQAQQEEINRLRQQQAWRGVRGEDVLESTLPSRPNNNTAGRRFKHYSEAWLAENALGCGSDPTKDFEDSRWPSD